MRLMPRSSLTAHRCRHEHPSQRQPERSRCDRGPCCPTSPMRSPSRCYFTTSSRCRRDPRYAESRLDVRRPGLRRGHTPPSPERRDTPMVTPTVTTAAERPGTAPPLPANRDREHGPGLRIEPALGGFRGRPLPLRLRLDGRLLAEVRHDVGAHPHGAGHRVPQAGPADDRYQGVHRLAGR